jgi:hypothetical protein
MGVVIFVATSFAPQIAEKPERFFTLLIFIILALIAPLISASFKRRTQATLERMFRAAVNIVELP